MSEFDALHARAADDLASVAVGEPADADILAHVQSCERCRRELDAYRHVSELARAAGHLSQPDEPPPAEVWSRITAELGLPSAATASAATASAATTALPTTQRPARVLPLPAAQPIRRRRPLMAAAAAVIAVLAAGAIGWAAGRSTSTSTPVRAMAAALQAQPGTTVTAHGTATMHAASGGFVMDVRTSGLPARDGFYEVWLYDPSATKMVAIGLLGSGGRGSFTVPAGLDVAAYHVVDVSIQRYNGDPQHGTSALRGQLIR